MFLIIFCTIWVIGGILLMSYLETDINDLPILNLILLSILYMIFGSMLFLSALIEILMDIVAGRDEDENGT